MGIFVTSPTELTTAVTDALLALVAFTCLVGIRRNIPRGFHRLLWQALFTSLAASSLLGAVVHGVRMSLPLNNLLWQPLYFFLALTVTLLAVIAVQALAGEEKTRNYLRYFLAAPCIVVALIWVGGGNFIWFILFEACAMLFVLGAYLYLLWHKREPGAGFILGGALVSVAAAVIQASGPYSLQVVWSFDHNGLFHLMQVPGVLCFYQGAVRSQPGVEMSDPGDVIV